MAARSHVDTSATVNERRLRPIYDCLDNGNNKKALHEAEKLLKKQKEFLCAKVLKALALIRLGRQEESLATLREVHAEGPTDDATLQAMTICYRELHKAELIADAYETAVKKEPQNEELLTHLFMSYVRLGEYKKQQQTAMMLYKLKPKNPYYFWAVMSIVMQANTGDEKLARNMLLPLAERMTDKFVKENKIEAEAEVQLYLMILENQEKFGEALQVLNGPLGEKKLTFYLDFLPQRRAELLTKLKRWPEANSAYKQLIKSNPDQWSYYVGYFNSVIQLVNTEWQPDDKSALHPPVDYTFEMTIDFISSLVQQQNNSVDNRVLRGPYLAQLDLLRCLLERKSHLASRLGGMVDMLMSYYEKFGSKPSCCLDMAHLVTSLNLSEDDIEKLLEKIRTSLDTQYDGDKAELPKDVKHMQRHLCYCQLSHYVGVHDKWTSDEKLLLVNDLIKRYHHGLQFGSNLLQTDFQPCDNYCLLAAHILIKMWQDTGDEILLVHAMVLLEQGLKKSPSSFQMKLMLIKLYNIIGTVGVGCALYESVDVKHIQQETLGYLISHPLVTGAHYTLASSVFGNALRFFTGNYKDTVDYLISCYKFGTFTKIPEIVSFREKLNNSLQYASVVVEKTILDLVLETKSHQDAERIIAYMDIDPDKDKILWDDLTDNRDVTVFRVWDVKQKEILEELKTNSFAEEVSWLKLRSLLVRTISAAFCLTKAQLNSSSQHHNDMANGEKKGMPDVLSDLMASLKEHVSSIDCQTLTNSHFPIQAPGPSRLRLYLQVGYINIFLSLVELVLYLYRLTEGPNAGQSEEKFELQMITNLSESFNGLVNRVLQNIATGEDLKLSRMKTLLEDLSNCIETLSLGVILLGYGHALLKPARSALVKKGRKKDAAPPVGPETFQHFADLVTGMEQAANAFQNSLEYLDDSIFAICFNSFSIEEPKISLEGDTQIMKQIKENVEKSYHLSTKELGDILQNKVKYLQSLKW